MTQTAIAKALKISQSNISHYIDGSKTPSLVNFAKLCELLDLDIEYILGIKN
ncbi:MAG: helix-turn-helix transcriptional regulator [Clostridia bacterium]|nr:helix-turn-helix transcriptional regulator [Clostridia bacterium]